MKQYAAMHFVKFLKGHPSDSSSRVRDILILPNSGEWAVISMILVACWAANRWVPGSNPMASQDTLGLIWIAVSSYAGFFIAFQLLLRLL